MNDINTHVCLMICLPRIFSVFKLHYSKMGSHLEVTFPSVFLWLLTTCTHVEKNFERKGSLPSDLVQSCLGTSTWNTPPHYSRPLTLAQVGHPRGSKSKRKCVSMQQGQGQCHQSKLGLSPISQQLFFLRGETPDPLRLWTYLGRICGFQWDRA